MTSSRISIHKYDYCYIKLKKTLRIFLIVSIISLVILSINLPASAQVMQVQVGATPIPTLPPGDGDVVTGNIFAAFATVIGFTCFSTLLLIGMLWFFNNRRQAN